MHISYYSVIGILAIIVHLIINYEMFLKIDKKDNFAEKDFRRYSLTVFLYYITDVLWGFFESLGQTKLLYADTILYYIAMALSVVCCCRYIISFLNLNKTFKRVLNSFGNLFCIAEFTLLVINIFTPVFFYIDSEGDYYPGAYRHIALIIQIVMFAVITLISFIVTLAKKSNTPKRNITISLFGFSMTVTIFVQTFYPLLPLYSIGLMIGTCVLHVFIQEDIKKQQYNALESMAAVFYSMHIINLIDDTVDEYTASHEVKEIVNHKHGATEMMKQVMSQTTSNEHVELALDFTDLSTLADRMVNKKIISAEFIGNRIGWFKASFIAMETDENNKPTKIIYATRIIDEEKKYQEKLIRTTQTDEMTGVLNRRAYEENIYETNDIPQHDYFIYISIDVNGLKVVNDSQGHMAGDELIIGVSQCMKKSLGPYGKLYRIGGDEFVATLFCDNNEIKKILADFDKSIANWKGKIIDNISVSYGWISKEEMPDATVRQLSAIAEERMYKAKSEHYRKQGMDRRGQQDAHKALCELYTKILRINITDDTYQIVNMDASEQTADKGFADKISEWLYAFGKSGQVHEEDLNEYLNVTNLDYMKKYFKEDKTSLSVIYRRRYDDGFKRVMMEIIPTADYSNDNQTLFLYVKNIDK